MAHHRYPCALLDLMHEHIAPAWDDRIDVPVLGEQHGHIGARLDSLYERPREVVRASAAWIVCASSAAVRPDSFLLSGWRRCLCVALCEFVGCVIIIS